jgi:hypothetical protein
LRIEAESSSGRQKQASAIEPANYDFETMRKEQISESTCIVVHAIPKHKEVYLFEDKI